MPTLHDLLEEAAGEPRPFDAAADLHRSHRAVARKRTRWAVGVTGGVVAIGAVTFAAMPDGSGNAHTLKPADGGSSGTASPDSPSGEVHLRYYDIPRPPAGWHVVGDRPQYAMLTRDGSGVTTINTGFIGQIVIGLTTGEKAYDVIYQQHSMEYDGRTFYTNNPEGRGTSTTSVRTADGNWLQIEYPASHFSFRDMVAYLDGVVVKDGAVPGDQSTGHVPARTVHFQGKTYYVGKAWLRQHPGWAHSHDVR
jgi:hypothetical protein